MACVFNGKKLTDKQNLLFFLCLAAFLIIFDKKTEAKSIDLKNFASLNLSFHLFLIMDIHSSLLRSSGIKNLTRIFLDPLILSPYNFAGPR